MVNRSSHGQGGQPHRKEAVTQHFGSNENRQAQVNQVSEALQDRDALHQSDLSSVYLPATFNDFEPESFTLLELAETPLNQDRFVEAETHTSSESHFDTLAERWRWDSGLPAEGLLVSQPDALSADHIAFEGGQYRNPDSRSLAEEEPTALANVKSVEITAPSGDEDQFFSDEEFFPEEVTDIFQVPIVQWVKAEGPEREYGSIESSEELPVAKISSSPTTSASKPTLARSRYPPDQARGFTEEQEEQVLRRLDPEQETETAGGIITVDGHNDLLERQGLVSSPSSSRPGQQKLSLIDSDASLPRLQDMVSQNTTDITSPRRFCMNCMCSFPGTKEEIIKHMSEYGCKKYIFNVVCPKCHRSYLQNSFKQHVGRCLVPVYERPVPVYERPVPVYEQPDQEDYDYYDTTFSLTLTCARCRQNFPETDDGIAKHQQFCKATTSEWRTECPNCGATYVHMKALQIHL